MTDTYTIRRSLAADWQEAEYLFAVAFGRHTGDADHAYGTSLIGPDGLIIAECDGHMIGTASVFDMSITVPGHTQLSACAISGVAVAPTHRRRGVLRTMMNHIHGAIDTATTPLAALTSSEGSIYGRFGYGVSTVVDTLSLDRRFASFHTRVPDPGGVRHERLIASAEHVKNVYDRWRLVTPGAQHRPEPDWVYVFTDAPDNRRGRSAQFVFTHPDGYALYRYGPERNHVHVNELVAVTPQAHIALWRALCGLDMATTIEVTTHPADPLRYLFTDARLVATTARVDGLWLRIMNIPMALSARGYEHDGQIVLAVTDSFGDDEVFALRVRGGVASCTPSASTADIQIDRDVLGALYLGAHSAADVAASQRLRSRTPEAITLLDQMMRADVPPHIGWYF